MILPDPAAARRAGKTDSQRDGMEHSYRRFALVNVTGLVLSGLLFTWLARSGTLDFWIERQFFDPVTQRFPFKSAPHLVFLGHTVLKNVTALGLVVAIVLALASIRTPALRSWRRALILFCVMAGGSAYLVQELKEVSAHACPWDLAMYGGHAQWFPLFSHVAAGTELGRCWPGGHASGGFAIIAGYFALRTRHPRWARRLLWLGLAMGTLMGGVQMVRGAHFLSHNLWTLWFVWATCFGIDALVRGVFRLWGKAPAIVTAVEAAGAAALAEEMPDTPV